MELIKQITELFENNPSDLNGIRTLLATRTFTEDELAKLALNFTDACFCEYREAIDPNIEDFSIHDMHSNHIVSAIALLLEFGLNPNTIVDDNNAMWNTMWIDAPDIAATTLRLLLENGGNPNHLIPSEGETLFEYIDFKVSYDEYTHDYLHTVQCWLLLMAYGACWRDNGRIPLTMLGGNSVEIFKNFEQFDYDIEFLPQVPGKFGCWIMHIYNVNTKEEVAVFK